jgi:hypothetical protein
MEKKVQIEHSPTPWAFKYAAPIHKDNGGYSINNQNSELAFVWEKNKRFQPEGMVGNVDWFGSDFAKQDACLMAAAPDMFNALQRIAQQEYSFEKMDMGQIKDIMLMIKTLAENTIAKVTAQAGNT